jgi:hypothetical protein
MTGRRKPPRLRLVRIGGRSPRVPRRKRATNVVGLYSALLRGEGGRRGRPQGQAKGGAMMSEMQKPTLEQMITDAAKLPPGPDAWAPIFEAFPGLTAEERKVSRGG